MRRILLAYDGAAPARRALETTAELALATGATVSVVGVVPWRPGRFPTVPPEDTDARALDLAEAQRLLREHGIETNLLEPVGDPARTIERIAEEGEFDVIVVGSRSLSPVSRALQGSVSEHVATHARSTVVVAR
jgi:nucleotide-binding universal stress UspA family protein